jgi:endonuclease/exonuclease/phosphatase family metal-dependent hydrolase
MKNFFLLLLLSLAAIPVAAQTRDTIRLCTWNIPTFTTPQDTVRANALTTVFAAIQPDVVVVQGVENAADAGDILQALLRLGSGAEYYRMAVDSISGSRLFYRPAELEQLGYVRRATSDREIGGWELRLRSTGDTMHLYSVNLTQYGEHVGVGVRFAELQVLREHLDSLPPGAMTMVAGTFNCIMSAEPAYSLMLGVAAGGQPLAGSMIDPINRPGDWMDNPEFADLHTGSTRVSDSIDNSDYGLFNRADQILVARTHQWQYVPGSYVTFGNDGGHFKDSVNALPNLAVGSALAQALHDASNHLPVYLDLMFTGATLDVDQQRPSPPMQMDLSDAERTR